MGDGATDGREFRGENVRRLRTERDDPKSRHPSAAARARSVIPPDRDPLGKMALFSSESRQPLAGTFLVDCSSCHRETPVSPAQLVRSAFPFSLHLPFVRKYHSLMPCPACGRRTWVRIRWQP